MIKNSQYNQPRAVPKCRSRFMVPYLQLCVKHSEMAVKQTSKWNLLLRVLPTFVNYRYICTNTYRGKVHTYMWSRCRVFNDGLKKVWEGIRGIDNDRSLSKHIRNYVPSILYMYHETENLIIRNKIIEFNIPATMSKFTAKIGSLRYIRTINIWNHCLIKMYWCFYLTGSWFSAKLIISLCKLSASPGLLSPLSLALISGWYWRKVII